MNGKEEVMAVFKRARSFWEARILMTAAELDIFSFLLDSPKMAAQVSEELSSDLRGTEILLNALAALELLVKEEEAFRVKPGLEQSLSSFTPETILPLLQHMAYLWKAWGNLTEIVLKGRKEDAPAHYDRSEKSIEAFIGAMHTIGREMAKSVISRLDLSGYKNLIDVGGGSGVYTIAMLRSAPWMHATIFDLPPVVKLARKRLVNENLIDRVTLVKGDFYKDILPGGHDLALLSAIMHQNSPEQNVELYRKIHNSLLPGGTLVIRDYIMSKDQTKPVEGALFAMNMLVTTPGGNTYSFNDFKEDLEAAGFASIRLLHQAEMDSLVTAQKPH